MGEQKTVFWLESIQSKNTYVIWRERRVSSRARRSRTALPNCVDAPFRRIVSRHRRIALRNEVFIDRVSLALGCWAYLSHWQFLDRSASAWRFSSLATGWDHRCNTLWIAYRNISSPSVSPWNDSNMAGWCIEDDSRYAPGFIGSIFFFIPQESMFTSNHIQVGFVAGSREVDCSQATRSSDSTHVSRLKAASNDFSFE